jgi:hypothetical protein
MTAKDRGFYHEKKNKEAILGENPYNERAKRDPFSRIRLKHKELGHDIRFRGYRTENERVSSVVEFNNKRDHSERDTKMIHHPNWRTGVNSKFKGTLRRDGSRKTFDSSGRVFSLKNKQAWNIIPIHTEQHGPNTYIEGLEKLGNDLSLKQRVKSKEFNQKNEFIRHTRGNLANATNHVSQSIRTKMVDDLREVEPK